MNWINAHNPHTTTTNNNTNHNKEELQKTNNNSEEKGDGCGLTLGCQTARSDWSD
jgi:hypothetical protein